MGTSMPKPTTFEEADAFVKGWNKGKGASNDDKLKAYGLFKQSNVGDVNTDRPGMFSPTDRAKWDAWEKNKGMSVMMPRQHTSLRSAGRLMCTGNKPLAVRYNVLPLVQRYYTPYVLIKDQKRQ